MADKSAIEWTDATWNPTTGCTKVSQGCKHCYAETLARRLQRMGSPELPESDWVREIWQQCRSSRVPFFFKEMGWSGVKLWWPNPRRANVGSTALPPAKSATGVCLRVVMF